jgi:hypothetical protein
MGKFSGHKRRLAPVSQDDQIAHYAYLLDTLPSSVIERAHAEAFTQLSAAQQQALFEQLRPLLSDDEPAVSSADPDMLATLFRRAEQHRVNADGASVENPRDAMTRSAVIAPVASGFVAAGAVTSYFTVGAGSVTIDVQPLWVNELVHHESATIDAGTKNHRRSPDGVWPYV